MNGIVYIYKNGVLVDITKNIVVQSGMAQTINLLTGKSTLFFKNLAIGSSSTALSPTQTTLVSQIAIAGATISIGTTSFSGDTAIYQTSFTFSTSYAVREMGIFSSTSGGIMLNRALLNVSVVNGDTLDIAWQIII